MCDITDKPSSLEVTWIDPLHTTRDSTFNIVEHNPNTEETIMHIYEEKLIELTRKFYDRNGKFFCRHPGTDWHLMEVPPGKALLCPAETTLKIVYDDDK